MSRFVRRGPFSLTDALVVETLAHTETSAPAARSAAMVSAQALLGAMAVRGRGLVVHADRVAASAESVGHALGLDAEELRELHLVALLHDVSRLMIPDPVLHSRYELRDAHREVMVDHAIRSESILAAIPALAPIAPAVRAATEHWDGSGQPDGLRHGAIPLVSRIVAACDAWDNLTSGPDAMDPDTARRAIGNAAGARLCPSCVDTLDLVLELR